MSSDRLTRADAIRIYEKVMHDVLGIPDASHPLRVALDRDSVTSLITLLSLSSSDIENLSYLPEQVDGDPIPRLTKVNAGHRGLIRQFQAWIVFLGVRSGGGTLTLEEYENLSPDAFDDFRISNATTSTQGTLPTVGSGAHHALPSVQQPTLLMTSRRVFSVIPTLILSSRMTSIGTTGTVP